MILLERECLYSSFTAFHVGIRESCIKYLVTSHKTQMHFAALYLPNQLCFCNIFLHIFLVLQIKKKGEFLIAVTL